MSPAISVKALGCFNATVEFRHYWELSFVAIGYDFPGVAIRGGGLVDLSACQMRARMKTVLYMLAICVATLGWIWLLARVVLYLF